MDDMVCLKMLYPKKNWFWNCFLGLSLAFGHNEYLGQLTLPIWIVDRQSQGAALVTSITHIVMSMACSWLSLAAKTQKRMPKSWKEVACSLHDKPKPPKTMLTLFKRKTCPSFCGNRWQLSVFGHLWAVMQGSLSPAMPGGHGLWMFLEVSDGSVDHPKHDWKNYSFWSIPKKNIPRLVFPLSDGQNGLGRTFGCCNEALVVWFLPGLEMQQPGQPALEIAMPGTSTKANQPWISALSSPKSRSYNPKIQQKVI